MGGAGSIHGRGSGWRRPSVFTGRGCPDDVKRRGQAWRRTEGSRSEGEGGVVRQDNAGGGGGQRAVDRQDGRVLVAWRGSVRRGETVGVAACGWRGSKVEAVCGKRWRRRAEGPLPFREHDFHGGSVFTLLKLGLGNGGVHGWRWDVIGGCGGQGRTRVPTNGIGR
jgi:hypothetical protein